jgi:hypothetical protein
MDRKKTSFKPQKKQYQKISTPNQVDPNDFGNMFSFHPCSWHNFGPKLTIFVVVVKLSKEIAQKKMFTVTPSTRHPGQKEQWLFHGKVNATCDNNNLQQNNESTAIFILLSVKFQGYHGQA